MINKRIKKCNKSIRTKNFIIKKISNPTKGEKEADGLANGGDRSNGYIWAMAESNNYIYIGSNRNIIYGLIETNVNQGNLAEVITNLIFKGDVSTETTDFAAEIFRYNKLSKEIELVYKSETTPEGGFYESGYRSAVAFKPYNEETESVYIGAFGNKYTRILKFKENYIVGVDKPAVVFVDNTGTSSVRAMATHENKLYFGLLINDTDLRVMESAAPNENTWNIIADLNDFKNIPSVDSDSAGAGGIFDLISYNGYLYAIIGSGSKPFEESGFLVFKGNYVGLMAEGANNYGWKWEMIVGPNGKYEAGMGVPSYAIATPFKYKASDGNEYVYVGTFSNVLQNLEKLLNFDFSYIYENFIKPTQLYRFDKNDDWEMVIGTPGESEPIQNRIGNYKAGFIPNNSLRNYSSNHYIWRMAKYNGKLFLGTFDSSTLYDYVIPKNIPDHINDFNEVLNIVLEFLSLIDVIDSDTAESLFKLFNDNNYASHCRNVACNNCGCRNCSCRHSNSNYNNKFSLSYACSHCNLIDPSNYLEEALSNLTIPYNLNILNSLKSFLPKDLSSDIESLIADTNYIKCRNCLNKNVMTALNTISKNIPTDVLSDDSSYLQAIYSQLSEIFGKETEKEIEKTIDELNSSQDKLRVLISKIISFLTSEEFLKQIYYMKEIRKMINSSMKGFDLYYSKDGVNFLKINSNGFYDKYNYGLRTFVSSKDGLYIGTANPFYGGQLWKLNEL